MARVTVQAIADTLGLSKFAVSRALSGHTGVSDATRSTVLQTAQQMGYVPRARQTPRGARIEILYHDLKSRYRELWSHVQSGAQMEGARRNVSTTVRWTADPKLIDELASETDGIMLIGPHSEEMLDAVRASQLPCVRIGAPLPALEPMDHVSGVDEEGSVALANHLISLGHRRLIYVHGQQGLVGRIRRCQALRDHVETIDGVEVEEIGFTEDSAAIDFRRTMEARFAKGNNPTAYVCGNDMVAVMVMSELMRMGISVPQQASVTGFGDYAVASQMSPGITTVNVPYQKMGIAALRLLLSRIGPDGHINDLPPQRLGLVGTLVIRGSTQ
jgi:LacI family transcriptional regulator